MCDGHMCHMDEHIKKRSEEKDTWKKENWKRRGGPGPWLYSPAFFLGRYEKASLDIALLCEFKWDKRMEGQGRQQQQLTEREVSTHRTKVYAFIQLPAFVCSLSSVSSFKLERPLFTSPYFTSTHTHTQRERESQIWNLAFRSHSHPYILHTPPLSLNFLRKLYM